MLRNPLITSYLRMRRIRPPEDVNVFIPKSKGQCRERRTSRASAICLAIQICSQHDLHQNLVRGVASTGASISAASQTQHRKISEVESRVALQGRKMRGRHIGWVPPTLAGSVLKTGGPNFHQGGHDSGSLQTDSSTATVSGHHFRASVRFDRAPETQQSERLSCVV